MIEVIASLGLGVLILAFVQWQYKQKRLSSEVARKIVHVTTGLLVISWPFFVSWHVIIGVEVVFFLTALITRRMVVLSSQHEIGRKSWGEFFFSLGVVSIILLGAPRWIFVLAILHLSFADTAAAIIGKRYGKTTTYRIFGQKKSLAGSAAFYTVSVLLIVSAALLVPNQLGSVSKLSLVSLPLVAMLVENIGVYGLDNLLIPLTVFALLHS